MLFRLTENVFVQDSDIGIAEPANWDELKGIPATATSLLTHAVHFYDAPPLSAQVQSLTAKSIREARCYAHGNVQLLSVLLKEDAVRSPLGFKPTAPVQRTVLDVHNFAHPKPLPILSELLQSAAAAADPEGYLIYSNADICLTPLFYNHIRKFLDHGVDALVVNRRTVDAVEQYQDWPQMAALDTGRKHLGFDCFIFPTAWVANFVTSDACVGMGMVMRPLLYNLIARADRMLILKDSHLTYHYGDDMPWKSDQFDDYLEHNSAQACRTLNALCDNPNQRARLTAFCERHAEPFHPGRPGAGAIRR